MAKRENQQQAQAERLKEILKGFGIRTQKDLDEALPKALRSEEHTSELQSQR